MDGAAAPFAPGAYAYADGSGKLEQFIRSRTDASSGMATGVWGANAPTFCQDNTRDFFKIDEKIIRGGVVTNLQRSRGRCRKISTYGPTFIALAMPLDARPILAGFRMVPIFPRVNELEITALWGFMMSRFIPYFAGQCIWISMQDF